MTYYLLSKFNKKLMTCSTKHDIEMKSEQMAHLFAPSASALRLASTRGPYEHKQ